MKKKISYMKTSNIISEGFFSKIAAILKAYPKLRKSVKFKQGVSSLNKGVKDLQKDMNDQLSKIDPDIRKKYDLPNKIKLNKFFL